MHYLATTYMNMVHPCYGFIDGNILFQDIATTWNSQSRSNTLDALLCGVAALGCLFSDGPHRELEPDLIALAKHLLDPSHGDRPSLHTATAWVLRTVYLRLTAKPEEAWLASCTTLHVIDAAGLMNSASHSSTFFLPQDPQNVHIRQRLFGVAQHLNTWMSFDLGRSRVLLPNIDPGPPNEDSEGYTNELLELLPYSQDLDPANGVSAEDLLTALEEVLNRDHTAPPSVLAQCNLMLCIYRRIHASKLAVPDDVMRKVLSLIKDGNYAVRSCIEANHPWHHVANIPFQSICTLLVIETEQSFALLEGTLACIVAVKDAYPTEATREAATVACTLLQLHRKRREAEMQRHSSMLRLYPSLDVLEEGGHSSSLNGTNLLDFWWFDNEFLAYSDLALDSTL